MRVPILMVQTINFQDAKIDIGAALVSDVCLEIRS